MVERLEWESPGPEGHGNPAEQVFFMSIYDKIMSVCGKNQVGLWEKSSRFVGKIRWTENFNEKYPHMHRKKILDYLCLFAQVPRLTTSI